METDTQTKQSIDNLIKINNKLLEEYNAQDTDFNLTSSLLKDRDIEIQKLSQVSNLSKFKEDIDIILQQDLQIREISEKKAQKIKDNILKSNKLKKIHISYLKKRKKK